MREQEENHENCKRLLKRVKDGEFITIVPYIVLIEVVAAIKRRTKSTSLAERVKNNLQNLNTINFLDIDSIRTNEAANIAKEFDIFLVSVDNEMVKKVKSIVTIKNIRDL